MGFAEAVLAAPVLEHRHGDSCQAVHDLPVSTATACVSQVAHWIDETEGYSSFQKIDRLSYLSFTYLSFAGWTGGSLSRTASGTMRLEVVSQLKVVEGGLQVASSYQLALTPLPSHRLRVSFVCANTDNSPRGAHRRLHNCRKRVAPHERLQDGPE